MWWFLVLSALMMPRVSVKTILPILTFEFYLCFCDMRSYTSIRRKNPAVCDRRIAQRTAWSAVHPVRNFVVFVLLLVHWAVCWNLLHCVFLYFTVNNDLKLFRPTRPTSASLSSRWRPAARPTSCSRSFWPFTTTLLTTAKNTCCWNFSRQLCKKKSSKIIIARNCIHSTWFGTCRCISSANALYLPGIVSLGRDYFIVPEAHAEWCYKLRFGPLWKKNCSAVGCCLEITTNVHLLDLTSQCVDFKTCLASKEKTGNASFPSECAVG